jgi:hypothetical protein
VAFDFQARAELVQARTDNLLLVIGEAARVDPIVRNVLLASTCARLTAVPDEAAVVVGPLFGLSYVALTELAKATGRSVDDVVAEYRRQSAAAVEQGLQMVMGYTTRPDFGV